MSPRSADIQDIQPCIQLHRPGKSEHTNNWNKREQATKENEPDYCAAWHKKVVFHSWILHFRTQHFIKKTFYLNTNLFSDGLDSLLVDPAHPRHTVFKCPDDPFHHHFDLEKKHFAITLTTKDATEKAIRDSYVTRVTTPGPCRRNFKSGYETYFLPFLCYPGRTHFWWTAHQAWDRECCWCSWNRFLLWSCLF